MVLAFSKTPVAGCPFCSAPSLTLSEQLAQADAAVLVEYVEGQKPAPASAETAGGAGSSPAKKRVDASTTYRIREVIHGPREILKKGDSITLARYRAGKKGDLFILTGTKGTTIEWSSPLEVTEASYKYIAEAPKPEEPAAKRLKYFLNFMEFPDQLVANDAYAEFSNAPYNDITAISDAMSRENVRKWITSPDTPATRLGLYGLMLGLCGKDEDAKLMEAKITEKTDDFRLGIDGVMSGYLLLKGNDGLDLIDKTKLENRDIPFSETYAAMQALRFMWTYGEERVEKERLRKSMRVLLDRPELADLVIADLARWKDWEIQDRLMDLYGADEYNIPSIKRAIVRYMLVSTKDKPAGDNVEIPEHVAKGQKHLDALREQDPRTVKEAERFFFLR
jgi:hypothetical protein